MLMLRFLLRWLFRLVVFFFVSTIGITIVYRFVPVWVTPLMVIRSVEQIKAGEKPEWHHTWVPIAEISKWLPQAVVSSEDNLFLEHNGFDFKQIQMAIDEANRGKRKRGASTISQQTAKNVFLWPGKSLVRKGLEAYFTVLIEQIWGKERIMEVYLNSIEMGRGIYGAEAVAHNHFKTTAAKLTKAQCALVAATLPNPIRFNSAKPSAYMLKRQGQILSLMDKIGPVKFE